MSTSVSNLYLYARNNPVLWFSTKCVHFLLKVVYTVFLSFLWELKKYVVGDCQHKYNNYYCYTNVDILLIHTFSTPTSDN